MPLNNDGEYEKLTKEEIQQNLENALNAKLDTTAQPGDLVTQQLAAEAETLAQNQEEAIKRVHRAAYLADATGNELDKVVDIIGLSRMEASPATGTIRLWRESPATSTYTVPSGSTVQTSGTDPIEFTITQQSALDYIDGFEDGNLSDWNGEVDSFAVLNTSELSDEYALEVPATDGVSITTDETDFRIGTTFTAEIKPNSGSVTGLRFGIQDQSNYVECVVDENAQDLRLRIIEEGGEAALSSNTNATIPTDACYLEIKWGLYDDTTATIYETKHRETEITSVTLNDSREWHDGAISVASHDANATALVDELSTRSTIANIESVGVGTETNLGPHAITTMGDTLTGVEQVSNPVATGDPALQDTTFLPFVLGEAEEADEELRERAFNSTAIGGSATANAISTELRRIEGVRALTLNRNREEETVNGLPPHSFEAIVYGGSDEEVANTIFNTASIDSHDVGGINGIEATYTINSDVTKDNEVINWSRPNQLELEITLDLIVDDTYVGETEIRSIIVNYIGGTGLDGNFIAGLDVGEDIYEAILKRKVVGPDETGVWEVNNLTIDKSGDGTDDTETTASGAEVLAVADNEVAVANARDGSISITKTQK